MVAWCSPGAVPGELLVGWLNLFNADLSPVRILADSEIPGGGGGTERETVPNTTLSPLERPEFRSCVKVEVAVLGFPSL